MRVTIITESFLPTVNGVSNSVAHVADELSAAGHQVLVVAPGPGAGAYGRAEVQRTPSVPLPGYAAIPVGLPSPAAAQAVRTFAPDVVHVAGPVAMGAWGVRLARRLDVPAVAVYQTDFPRYAAHYRIRGAERVAWRWTRHVHGGAARTLAPSTAAVRDLRSQGVADVHLWGRGVDLALFEPSRRSERLRDRLAPDGGLLVGYMGRLAREKALHHLAELLPLRGGRLVIIGDGPDRSRLERLLPDAIFTGFKHGIDLAAHVASLDVFVHAGPHETFCQAIQEGLACGVPVVAPRVGGPTDLIQHGRNGLLFTPGDGGSLRDAVAALANDPAARRRMGAEARRGVAGRTWPALVDELVGHYRAVQGGEQQPDAVTLLDRSRVA